jgi:hypothetical protein
VLVRRVEVSNPIKTWTWRVKRQGYMAQTAAGREQLQLIAQTR